LSQQKKSPKKLKSLEREMGRKGAQNDIEDEMVVFRTHIQSHTQQTSIEGAERKK